MRDHRRQRGQTLILLAAWLYFSGGASTALVVYDRSASDTKKAVKSVITDVVRRDPILYDISQWDSNQATQDKMVGQDRKELLKTLRQKDAKRSDVELLTAKLDERLLSMDRDFLDLRFRLKQQVTSAEWSAIVARSDR